MPSIPLPVRRRNNPTPLAGRKKERLTGVAAANEEEALVRREVEAEQRRQGRVLLVPVEGPGLLAVALVPVPCLAVRLRRRGRAATSHLAAAAVLGSEPASSTGNGARCFRNRSLEGSSVIRDATRRDGMWWARGAGSSFKKLDEESWPGARRPGLLVLGENRLVLGPGSFLFIYFLSRKTWVNHFQRSVQN